MIRREFIKATSAFAGGLSIGISGLAGYERVKIENFGIQLWTVRHEMTGDPKGTLKALRDFGYKQIESFGDGKPENIFWGMTPKEFKKYLDDLDLSLISAHCDSDYTFNMSRLNEFEKLAEDAAGINMKYLINPFMIQLKTIDDFKRAADAFNNQGEICKRNGLRFAYHNHNYSFRKIEGLIPQSILLDQTDADLVDFEMDIYWVVDAGEDPIEWLKKYPNRFKLCHIKDHYPDSIAAKLVANEVAQEPELGLNVSCDLGKGKINFHKILSSAQTAGMQYYLVEQERFDHSSPLRSAEKNARYMIKNFL